MFESTPQFPPDAGQQTYLAVQAIVAGRLYLRDKRVFQDSIHLPDSSGFRAPDFCFLITHPTKGRILFDLGIRKVRTFKPLVCVGFLKQRILEWERISTCCGQTARNLRTGMRRRRSRHLEEGRYRSYHNQYYHIQVRDHFPFPILEWMMTPRVPVIFIGIT